MKYIVNLNGKNYEVEVEETEAVITGVADAVAAPVAAPVAAAPAPAQAPSAAVSADGAKVISPMPGTILSVNKNVGDSVNEGDVIMILEAMKMENEIVAPASGTIKQLLVSKGSTVDTDAVLAVVG